MRWWNRRKTGYFDTESASTKTSISTGISCFSFCGKRRGGNPEGSQASPLRFRRSRGTIQKTAAGGKACEIHRQKSGGGGGLQRRYDRDRVLRRQHCTDRGGEASLVPAHDALCDLRGDLLCDQPGHGRAVQATGKEIRRCLKIA